MAQRRRLIGALVLSSLLLVGLAGTAQAKTFDEGPFSDSGTDSGVCGKYDIKFNVKGYFWIQDSTPELNGQFFYYSEVGTFHGVYTNPDNGKRFVEDYSWTRWERNAKQAGADPNIFTYETKEVGIWTVRTNRGKVAYLSPGTVIASYLFDSEGDSAPGGHLLEEPVVLKDTFKPLDFCALADDLIG